MGAVWSNQQDEAHNHYGAVLFAPAAFGHGGAGEGGGSGSHGGGGERGGGERGRGGEAPFGQLRELDLCGFGLGARSSPNGGPTGADALAALSLTHLTRLRVAMSGLDSSDVWRLFSRAPWAANLVELELHAEDLITAPGIEALGEVAMPRLKRFMLEGCQLSPDAVCALNDARWLAGLERLKLSDCLADHDEFDGYRLALWEEGQPLARMRAEGRLVLEYSS